MSSSEEEIREQLEGKQIELSDNVNDYDSGSDSSEQKLGNKSLLKRVAELEAQIAELKGKKREGQSWGDYVQERQRKMAAGDPTAISEYVEQQTKINEELKARVEQSRAEYDARQAEKKRLEREARITPEQRQKLEEDIQKLERKRDKEIGNVYDYFNSSESFWNEYQRNGHTADESPAGALITTSDNGTWCCDIHRYEKVIEGPDGNLYASSFTLEPVEEHFRKDPGEHIAALVEITNNKYQAKINERKALAELTPEQHLKREVREIEGINTRSPGDITRPPRIKSEKTKLREAEEEENEKNRRIYKGLYS